MAKKRKSVPADPEPEIKADKTEDKAEEKKPDQPKNPVVDQPKKRYDVSLAKVKEPNCYVLFYRTDSLADAKKKCVDTACDEGRACIVWDYEAWDDPIIFRWPEKKAENVKDDKTAKQPAPAAEAPPAEAKPKPKSKYKPAGS